MGSLSRDSNNNALFKSSIHEQYDTCQAINKPVSTAVAGLQSSIMSHNPAAMNSSLIVATNPEVVDLEEMHGVIVTKIQSLRKIAFDLEAKIAEQEAFISKNETTDGELLNQIDSSV